MVKHAKELKDLEIFFLNISIKFSNLNFLTDRLVGDHKTYDKKNLLDQMRDTISQSIDFLESITETLLSSLCIDDKVKISLAVKTREFAYDIKIFLMANAHILRRPYDSGNEFNCHCCNHKNINRLIKIFIDVIGVK